MSLMDVEDYEASIGQVWRVLNPGGILLMSITHPCFSAPTSCWVKDESDKGNHFAVDHPYFLFMSWRKPNEAT